MTVLDPLKDYRMLQPGHAIKGILKTFQFSVFSVRSLALTNVSNKYFKVEL